jgi:hypothetical protein
MCICFYNGYPMYDGDTHSYLDTGFSNTIPPDRTPFYGLFIRIASLWTSLWFTIFSQCLILSYVLLRFIRLLNPRNFDFSFGLMSIMAIASFTCVSWVCAELMPDIFAGILLVAILLYLFDQTTSIVQRIICLLIIILAVSIHNSNFLILFLFSTIVFLYSIINKYKLWIKKSLTLISISVAFYFFMCTLHFNNKDGFVFSPSSDVFTMAKLSSSGILGVYLDDNCGKKDLRLCTCKDQLPAYPWDFIWPAPSNPVLKVLTWDSCNKEFSFIIHDVFTTPKYLRLVLQKSCISTIHQLYAVQIENKYSAPLESDHGQKIKKYYEDEFNEFSVSKQNSNTLDIDSFKLIYNLFFVLSSLWILLLYKHPANRQLFRIYCWILIFFVVNAFVTTFFSTVFYRYQYRIFWLLPATNAILILKYLQEKYRNANPSPE